MRENHIFVDFGVQVGESGPLARVDLHDIKHHSILHLLLGVIEILEFHLLEESALLLLQVSDLFLGVHGDVAYGGPPAVQVPLLLGHALLTVLVKVSILDLSLSFPVLLQVFLPQFFHLCGILLLLLNISGVFFPSNNGLIGEARGVPEERGQGVAAKSRQLLHILMVLN